MAGVSKGVLGVGLSCLLLGCGGVSPVPAGSLAETQLHAPCPAQAGCVEPLTCVGGEDAREPATCELACNRSCPLPLQCMPRSDGQHGGVCLLAPERRRGWGS